MAKRNETRAGKFYFPHSERLSEQLRTVVGPEDVEFVRVKADIFRFLLKSYLKQAGFPEAQYIESYEDLSEAQANGQIGSPLDHFVSHGVSEKRVVPVEVDEDYYLDKNKDVEAGVIAGTIESAQSHFENYGYKEGRTPSEGLEELVEKWNELLS